MDETSALLEKWLGRKNEKEKGKKEKDKHPCLTCRDDCFPFNFCPRIRVLPLIRMEEKELDELEKRTRPIRIDWAAFYRRKRLND